MLAGEWDLRQRLVLGPLLDAIDTALTEAGMSIVHLKAVLHTESGSVKAALCGNGVEPEVEGMLDASPARVHELLLNLRGGCDADTAKAIVERCLQNQDAEMSDLRSDAFHPAAPRPERRVSRKEVAMRTNS